jgi:hypothetical protein
MVERLELEFKDELKK